MLEIKVQEILDAQWSDWFNPFAMASEAGSGRPTSGVADRAVSPGILSEIRYPKLMAGTRLEGAPSQQTRVESETGRRFL